MGVVLCFVAFVFEDDQVRLVLCPALPLADREQSAETAFLQFLGKDCAGHAGALESVRA